MLVKDFFQQQKKQGISTAEKFLLYEKISLGQKNSQHGISRNFSMKNRLLKVGVLSVFVALLGVGIFQGLSNDYNNTRSMLTFRKGIKEYNNFSHASAIGQVVKAQGHFTITKDGQLVVSDEFSDGDILSLDKFSTMTFDINNSIQAKIVGPAKFTVHKISLGNKEPSYRIHMLEGNFISVKSKNGNIAQQTIEVTTPDGVIIQEMTENKGETIDFSMVKKDKKALVYNKGTNNIRVVQSDLPKKSNTEKNPKLSVINKKDIDNNKGEGIDVLTKEIVDLVDNLDSLSSGEVELNTSGVVLTGGIYTGNDITGSIVTSGIYEGNEITKVSIINRTETKQQKQIKELDNLTYKAFVKLDIENVFKYYLLGNVKSFDISVSNLSSRLKKMYTVLGYKDSFNNPNTIEDLYKLTDNLLQIIKKENINTDDSISQSNITVIKNRLFILKDSYSFGEYSALLDNKKKISFNEIISQINFEQKAYLNFK